MFLKVFSSAFAPNTYFSILHYTSIFSTSTLLCSQMICQDCSVFLFPSFFQRSAHSSAANVEGGWKLAWINSVSLSSVAWEKTFSQKDVTSPPQVHCECLWMCVCVCVEEGGRGSMMWGEVKFKWTTRIRYSLVYNWSIFPLYPSPLSSLLLPPLPKMSFTVYFGTCTSPCWVVLRGPGYCCARNH